MIRAIAVVLALGCSASFAGGAERRAERIADGVYVLQAEAETGGERPVRARAAFVVGPLGVAVINTGISYREGVEILAAVRRVTRRPVRLAIITHPGQETLFGAAAFQSRGIAVVMHKDAAALMAARCQACLRNLTASLGSDAMEGTRVVVPDRLIDGEATIGEIGRRLLILAPPRSSAPGALAVFDERTATLFAGNLVSPGRVPDLRDADGRGWPEALGMLAATRCRHLVPSYGAIGRCSGIDAFANYFRDLEARVAALLREGTGLAEVGERSEMDRYASWDRYDALHRANAARAYLRLERALFDAP